MAHRKRAEESEKPSASAKTASRDASFRRANMALYRWKREDEVSSSDVRSSGMEEVDAVGV